MESHALAQETEKFETQAITKADFQVLEGEKNGALAVQLPAAQAKPLFYRAVKRAADIVCSLAALFVLSPVFLITAAAIRLEDGGPVFYVQRRIGKGEKEFKIYKFRSMKRNAEQIHEELKKEYKNNEVSFKLKNDPRVTKVGKVIRKTNIDELPQLLNILIGNMSIVGPRPLPVYEYEEERQRYGSTYKSRYEVPQGLTCYWQVSDRADVEFEDRMQLDVDYVSDCGCITDIKLIAKTVYALIRGRAGY